MNCIYLSNNWKVLSVGLILPSLLSNTSGVTAGSNWDYVYSKLYREEIERIYPIPAFFALEDVTVEDLKGIPNQAHDLQNHWDQNLPLYIVTLGVLMICNEN